MGAAARLSAAQVHGAIGGARSALQGGKFATGFLTGAVAKIATPFSEAIGQGNPLASALASAAVGGTVSELGGGKFANGALTGAYGYLFNQFTASRANPIERFLPAGRGPVSPRFLKPLQPLVDAASRASAEVPDMGLLFGWLRGIYVHSAFARNVRALQAQGLSYAAEVSYMDGARVTYGQTQYMVR